MVLNQYDGICFEAKLVTYKMKKCRLILICAAILPLLAPPNKLLATTKQEAKYPENYVSDYIKSCIQRATAEGLPELDAESVCNCTIARFQAQYTLDELNELTKTADSNPEAAEALREVGTACFEEILYEN